MEHSRGFRRFPRHKELPMPYALFENEFRLSRTFPTATDVWRCAEDCGLVIDDGQWQAAAR